MKEELNRMHLLNIFSKLIYWPVCRDYARHLENEPADSWLRLLSRFQFRRVHGFWPNYHNPRHFTEKLWCRMLLERNPQLTLFCDKLLVQKFVSSRIGSQYLVPLLWSGKDPKSIPFDELPSRFVLKTNHGCAYNILVPDKAKLDVPGAISQLERWLRTNFCTATYLGISWGYRNIPPAILVEEYLGENDQPPVDYKFYCFGKRVEFLTVHYNRFSDHKTRSFDRQFAPYNFSYDFEQWDGHCEKPANFDEMVKVAEALADGCEFVRVDLYSVGPKIYFSELTPYPGGVSTKILPRSTDLALGGQWKVATPARH
ncbi:MAG: hypothetical protein H7X97_14090 [Opitutaceae bacterium]|nr:hypothetical protein [Verrucomicrobiales bacterium]